MSPQNPADFLVSTEWLQNHLNDPAIQIFDCTASVDKHYQNRGFEEHYSKHHIPGAAYLDIGNAKGEFTNSQSDLPFCWPDAEHLIPTLKKHGINPAKKIILYSGPNPLVSGSGMSWATRAWWILHSYGFDCAVLNGGWRKWQSEGRPASAEASHYPALSSVTLADYQQQVAFKQDVLDHLQAGNPLIDSLSDASYSGKVDSRYGKFGLRAGHITGAINVHYEDMFNPADDTFLAPEAIRQHFIDAGVDLNKPLITYCGGGIGATVTGFALKLAGVSDTRIYDGSLMEWCNDLSLPMSNPSETEKGEKEK